MQAIACRTVTISQSLSATTVANGHLSVQNKLNVDSSKAFGSEYYPLPDEAISQLVLDDELSLHRHKRTIVRQ